jgi:hypothetical protein
MKMLTAPACGLEKKRLSSGADLSPAPSLAGEVYNILRETARRRHTITYKELAAALGLDWGRKYGQCRRLYPILKGICRAETAQGRPMLGAVVVRRDGMPGQGFFRGASDLGRLNTEDELSFWRQERDRVWEKWSGNIEKE